MSEGIVRNAANPRQVRAAKKIEKTREKIEKDDLAWLLSDRRGRRIYWKWMSMCGPFKQSFSQKGNDRTNFNEGRRSIGLLMLDELTKVKPEAYVQMSREDRDEEFLRSSPADKDRN
jgi:hypothetical protein